LDIVTLALAKKFTKSTVAIGGVLTSITRQPNGDLLITYTPTSGSPIVFNAGNVPAGRGITDATIGSNGHLTLTFDDAITLDVGRVTGTDGIDGREIELSTAGTVLRYRYVGTVPWTEVFDFADIEIPAAILDYVSGATYPPNTTFTDPATGIIYRANRSYTAVSIDADLTNGDIRQIGGGGSYTHTQNTASAVWTIPHNLGQQFVDVQIIDNAGITSTADIAYTGIDVITITFSVPMTGTAIIRR